MNQDPLKENRDLLEDFLLEGFPNPEREGCPHETRIKALAEERLLWNDPAGLHVASCSECYDEYTQYRKDWEELQAASLKSSGSVATVVQAMPTPPQRTPKSWHFKAAMAIAASVVVVCSLSYIASKYFQSARVVNARIDLFETGTVRGTNEDAPAPLSNVTLPARIVHLSVVLPPFSDAGPYRINVSTDKAGNQIVSSSAGNAVATKDGKVSINVTLDLRAAKPGTYFLGAVRGIDNGTYYYSIQIR